MSSTTPLGTSLSKLWASTEREWDQIAAAIRRAGICGSDTETYGHDVRKSTPTHRAKIHVWSIAVRTTKLHPRGHKIAVGRTLPVEALLYPPLRAVLEDENIVKVYHNAAHDVHAKRNYGVVVRNFRDTLTKARCFLPGLEDGYGLKVLCSRVRRKLTHYEDVLSVPRIVEVRKTSKVCDCGLKGCRKRSGTHTKKTVVVVSNVVKGTELCPLELVVPGHPLFNRLCDYACEDSVTALELDENLDMCDEIEEYREPLINYDVSSASSLLR